MSKNPKPSAPNDAVHSRPARHVGEYTIQKDDTLSRIAHRVYGSETRWAEVYAYNSRVIGKNANALTIGTQLQLPPDDFRLSEKERAAIYKAAARAKTVSAVPPKSTKNRGGASTNVPNTLRGDLTTRSRTTNVAQTATTPLKTNYNSWPSATQITERDVVAFFIGGAADKKSYGIFFGPHGHIVHAQKNLDSKIAQAGRELFYQSHYLDYRDVRGNGDIKKNVLDVIPSMLTPVYIIGHSLGGWNGAHLSRILYDKGYNIAILVTLDPVGKGALVYAVSDIYRDEPEPRAKFWINIRATPKNPDGSDDVADFGEQWIVNYGRNGPDMSYTIDANHFNAGSMFRSPLGKGPSAADIVRDDIIKYVDRK